MRTAGGHGSAAGDRVAEEAEGEAVRKGGAWAGHTAGTPAGAMTAPRPVSGGVDGSQAAPAKAGRDTARRVVPLFRPYRTQVAAVVGLIVVTSTVGIINPLLIQAVFNRALFVPGGPDLRLLVILVAVMAVVPIVSGAIGILQTYETTRVGQQVIGTCATGSTRTGRRSRWRFSPAPGPARSGPGWPATWAASSRWSPPPPQPSCQRGDLRVRGRRHGDPQLAADH